MLLLIFIEFNLSTMLLVNCMGVLNTTTTTTTDQRTFQQVAPPDMDLTFLGTRSIFKVPSFYHFYTPNVSVNCECACDHSFEYCGRNNFHSNVHCARVNNFNHSCTCFRETIANEPSCYSKSANVCCQVHFLIPEQGTEYTASKLARHITTFLWKVTYANDSSADITFNVPENVSRFSIDEEHVIQLPEYGNYTVDDYDWVYTWKGSNKLIPSESLNGLGEQDLGRLGWFQKGYNHRLRSVRANNLLQHLNIQTRNCGTGNQSFEWELNATTYYHATNKQLQGPILEKKKKEDLWNPHYNNIMDWLTADTSIDPPNDPVRVGAQLGSSHQLDFKFSMALSSSELELNVNANNLSSDSEQYCLKVYTDVWNSQVCFEPKNDSVQQLHCQLPTDTTGIVWICLGESDRWKQTHTCKVAKVVLKGYRICGEFNMGAMFTEEKENLFVFPEVKAEPRETQVPMKINYAEGIVIFMLFVVICVSIAVSVRYQHKMYDCFKKRTQKVVGFETIYHPTTKLLETTT